MGRRDRIIDIIEVQHSKQSLLLVRGASTSARTVAIDGMYLKAETWSGQNGSKMFASTISVHFQCHWFVTNAARTLLVKSGEYKYEYSKYEQCPFCFVLFC
ncbi:uncharacterized protein YALI1_E37678g [Yarrowia lipolytica]|uniref:Uncharacterized protein n=1 Tax=Yarrowia lipolytica TaxID=4952 RepID=A0A1D8NKU8_YARLL|nr:hypothetical protein YALI1_E37678g [Yarrowia lipolytica]